MYNIRALQVNINIKFICASFRNRWLFQPVSQRVQIKKILTTIYVYFDYHAMQYKYNICTLSANIKFICMSSRNRQKSEHFMSFSSLFCSECKLILYLPTMQIYLKYAYVDRKYIIYLYEFQKQVKKTSFSSLFRSECKLIKFAGCCLQVITATVSKILLSYLSEPIRGKKKYVYSYFQFYRGYNFLFDEMVMPTLSNCMSSCF